MDNPLGKQDLEYLINHIFMPLKLPSQDDYSLDKDRMLCDLMVDALQDFQETLDDLERDTIIPIMTMLQKLRSLLDFVTPGAETLVDQIQNLRDGGVLVLPVRSQNACIIVRKSANFTTFEVFEVDPPNHKIMGTIGKVVQAFPDKAIKIPTTTLENPYFQQELASFLAHMSNDVLDSAAMSKKAGVDIKEPRDTAHPHYITDLFFAILRGVPGAGPTNILAIQKRVENDIVWNKAYLPWRRSPLWLIIRVAIQTTLCLSTGSRLLYKLFIIHLTSDLLHHATENQFPSHILHCLRAKVARKVSKLGDTTTDALSRKALGAIEKATKLMQDRWDELQKNLSPSQTSWKPEQLDVQGDTSLSLRKSKAYINACYARVDKLPSPIEFQPVEHTRLSSSKSSPAFASRDFPSALLSNSLTALGDFEESVQVFLDDWLVAHYHDSDASAVLSSSIETYASAALKAYKGNPEDVSIMFLTIFDLWVALDKVAIHHHPMLQEYSPEVSVSLLNPLLLRSGRSLQRYQKIQAYIQLRHEEALGYSVFSESDLQYSFPVRYLESSDSLKALKDRIEWDAECDKQKRLANLDKQQKIYSSHLAEAAQMDHLYRINRKGRTYHDRRTCKKCRKESIAKDMKIEIYEWPLSSDGLQAKRTVFELRPPLVFRNWRRITYTILYDYCRPELSKGGQKRAEASLETYPGLEKYASEIDRISLWSPTKSFGKSHYKSIPVSAATVTNSILPNALNFRLFDAKVERWAADSLQDCGIWSSCTWKLSKDGPYRNLQFAVSGVSHSSNDVIAGQYTAPSELSLHEHIAFGTLRAGAEIQWLNILRELHAQTLSLDRLETQTLLLQASWQVGEYQGTLKWHQVLFDPTFSRKLLLEIRDVMTNIQDNWLHLISLETLTRLVSRLLASTDDAPAMSLAYELLKRARSIAYRWMKELSGKLQNDTDQSTVIELQPRLCAAALVCRATYDVDEAHLYTLLQGDEDIAIFLECLVRAHDNMPPDAQLAAHLQTLIPRDRRLSHRTHHFVSSRIERSRTCLDLAISKLWSAYSSGSFWHSRYTSNSSPEWLMSSTADGCSQIHINIMDGTLLINGKPLNRLPQHITQHGTYKRLFGKQILDVVPSNRPYMEFCTREAYPGTEFNVHFGMLDRELIIQASNISEVYELIPHTILLGDFPEFLVSDYFHWLCLKKDTHGLSVEFRPLAMPWKLTDVNWVLKSSLRGRFHLERTIDHTERLVDIRSRSFNILAERLGPLERGKYIIITIRISDDRHVLIDLPRHRLSFCLNEEYQLESRDLREMVVDDAPSGCMFGLQNQLVLRPKDLLRMHLARARCILIPCGQVFYQTSGHHVDVTIDTGGDRDARHFKYDIDTNLGYLAFPGQSLEAEYYKIYLHALTSHCLPDPLTGRTGTEEALAELSSAKCQSFQFLGDKERDLLFLIAGLAPAREWYPPHLKSMQVVQWRDELSPLSQHWAFFTHSRSILDFAEKLTIFQPNQSGAYAFPASTSFASNDHLRDRAAIRGACYFAPDYAYIEQGTQHDNVYVSSNDRSHHQTMSPDAAAKISALVLRRPSKLETVPDLWERFCTAERLLCGTTSLSYDVTSLRPKPSELWIPMYNACSQENQGQDKKSISLAFSMSAMAYTSTNHGFLNIIPTLLSFSTIPEFKDLPMPQWPSWSEFDLTRGTAPNSEVLFSLIRRHALPFEDTSYSDLVLKDDESEYSYALRRRQAYNSYSSICDRQTSLIVNDLVSQWSGQSEYVSLPGMIQPCYISSDYMIDVCDRFKHWYRNLCLRNHVTVLQRLLDRSRTTHNLHTPLRDVPRESSLVLGSFTEPSPTRPKAFISLLKIAENANFMSSPSALTKPPRMSLLHSSAKTDDLKNLIQKFRLRNTELCKLYADALEESRNTLEKESRDGLSHGDKASDEEIPSASKEPHYLVSDNLESANDHLSQMFNYLEQAKDHFATSSHIIKSALKPSNLAGEIIFAAGCWPRVTNRAILQLLSHKSGVGPQMMSWKKALAPFGQSLMCMQHAQRCVHWAIQGSLEELEKELQKEATANSQSLQDPEWLLIQVEGNFMTRPLQEKVALEMISPSSQNNTLLQLNMGEGKTSVIVPIVAARLADKDKLVRVIVLKPLKNQMFSSLVSRLGGLVNRRIFYVPFSRDIRITQDSFYCLNYLLTLCRKEGGILVTQPEHLLSLRLMTVDMMLNLQADSTIVSSLQKQQSWLRTYARDILDESDEILSVEYQLVYTNGQQSPLEHHPIRWRLVQHVLDLVKRKALVLFLKYPSGLEVHNDDNRPSTFPIIRILDETAWKTLLYDIGYELIYGVKSEFRLCSIETRSQAFEYITNIDFNIEDQEQIQSLLGVSLWTSLLLYRGLLAHGILKFALKQKRWRVDYGLDPTRTLLAVPYKAKDVPSPRADFGHPDVALILTCLSYYYGGLTDDQVELCFDTLFKLDNPELEYYVWTRDHDAIPDGLRHISGVNWKDIQQRQQYLIPLFRKAYLVINFYLNTVVFPKEAKQFPFKLSTSAWDLSERTVHVKTGFSGTNDNQHLLPIMMHQRDPVNQLSTNAKVMTYLLQPENNFYNTYGSVRKPLTGSQFLEFLTQQHPEVRVLLDVGAQMLDMRNDELVKQWLSLCHSHVQAAVFFDEANDLCIMTRDDRITPFSSSPFNERLDACIVYLDDAHTRGTDLKLPSRTRAAVTLGPKVTKDRLVQGCMRMRKLGYGQSVIFLAPPEIDKKIRAVASKNSHSLLASSDVLLWAMSETCDRIAHYIGYWAHQGVNYMRRQEASDIIDWEPHTPSKTNVAALRRAWVEPESRSLEDMYAAKANSSVLHASFSIPELRSRLVKLGADSIVNSLMDEEQEREVSHEMEQQRQVQRPSQAKPAQHSLHPDVRKLVHTGVIAHLSSAFISPLASMDHLDSQSQAWSNRILATADFSKTIVGQQRDITEFLRPVNWVITICSNQSELPPAVVILSPYEVNALIFDIRRSKHVHLHMFTPRTAETMTTLDDLRFHCMPPLCSSWKPPSLTDIGQLSLWAGQLYLRDYEAYETLCQTLGLVSGNITQKDGAWDGDGFVKMKYRDGRMASVCRFERNPVPFIKTLVSLRRKGMEYRKTHIGRILHREALTKEDFMSKVARSQNA